MRLFLWEAVAIKITAVQLAWLLQSLWKDTLLPLLGCSLFGPESLILNNILPVYLKVLGEGEGLKGNTFLAWLFHSLNKYLLGAYYMQYASIVWLLWIQSE